MDQIRVLAAALRQAVDAEQFAQAERLTAEYARLVTERWHALRPGDPEIAGLWGEARELLAWARQTSLAQRAQVGGRLLAIEPLAAYLRSQVKERSTWEIQG